MKRLTHFLLAVAVFGLLLMDASAQVTPNAITKLDATNSLAGPTTNTAAITFDVRSNRNLGIMMVTTGGAAITGSNVIATFSYSGDGTNYSGQTTSVTNSLTASTKTTGWFVIPTTTIGPARKMKLETIKSYATNATTFEIWTCWPY